MPPHAAVLKTLRIHARMIFDRAVAAVDPGVAITRHARAENHHLVIGQERVDLDTLRRLYIIGAGKAGAAMARAMEKVLPIPVTDGVVVVKYGHGLPLGRVRLIEAGHPVPDENSLAGSREILAVAGAAGEDDLVLCLLSGGGSSLLAAPVDGITLADKQAVTRLLLGCGATIREVNTVRKHLSRIKGGGLSKAVHPARMVTLALSDVVGDDPATIASGPTVPDTGTFTDCIDVIDRYDLRNVLPQNVLEVFAAGRVGALPETPKPLDPCFFNQHLDIVGNNSLALQAAAAAATELGYRPLILSSGIQGEARDAALVHAAIARESLVSGNPIPPPACILSGGETAVTLRGNGKGGRSQEFALAAAIALSGMDGNLVLFSAGTDGTDGPTDAAGAVADPETVHRATALGLSATQHLADNNAYPLFQRLDDLVITGPTRTNVMDIVIMLIA